jgi:hypothetical protein
MTILTHTTGSRNRSRARRGPSATPLGGRFRMLIREEPLATGADVLADAAKRMGDERLRVSRKP